jgi:putative hemolysin
MLSLLVLFFILLGSSAFFSGSETALFSLSELKLRRSKLGARTSSALFAFLKSPREMLVTILLGNELVNVSLSIVGAALISRTVRLSVEVETVAAVAIITPILLVWGEIIPKNVALRFADQLAPVIIWPLRFFSRLILPLRLVLTWIADRMVSLFGGKPESTAPIVMEEEYKRLIDLGRKEGVIVEEERELIHKVFEFTDKRVADIMTPAGELFSLSLGLPYEQVIEEIKSTQFSRVPFYREQPSNIVGVLHVRDLFAFHRRLKAGEELGFEELLRPPLFVDSSIPLETLLVEFQRSQMHMAIVRGKDGAIHGIVTMHDVLEVLFGEMEV